MAPSSQSADQRYARYAENHLLVEIDDRVATVTINRPEKRNAVNFGVHEGLEHAIRELGRDPEVGAIVLTGAGVAFCAGGDIGGFQPPGQKQHPLFQTREPRDLVHVLVNCEAPLIAAVNGTAAGLGATIALLCDVIYMADSAKIGDTHVKMGLVAGDGGQVIWPLLVGPHRAKELLMSGRLVPGPEAAAMGLVNHCVPAEKLLDEARAFAQELADGPQLAIRWTKLAINRHLWQSVQTALDFGLVVEGLSAQTEDMKEAASAFLEKRKPRFQGR